MKISSKQFKLSIIAVVVVILLFFLHYVKVLKPFENLILRALRPVQTKVYQLSDKISFFYHNSKTKNELQTEVTTLQNELADALVDSAQLKILEEENLFLRQQLEFSLDDEKQKIISRVISKSDDETINTLTIDKGKKDGIQVGSPVVVGQGVIIGKVIKISDYTSTVLLINDHSSQLAATILDDEKTVGLIKGEYGLGVKMELIPQSTPIQEKDIIITSGIEEQIPRGLVIGTIDTIISFEEEIFKEAVIKLPYNLNKIYLVNVIISKE